MFLIYYTIIKFQGFSFLEIRLYSIFFIIFIIISISVQ